MDEIDTPPGIAKVAGKVKGPDVTGVDALGTRDHALAPPLVGGVLQQERPLCPDESSVYCTESEAAAPPRQYSTKR